MTYQLTKGDLDQLNNKLDQIVRRQNQQQKTLDLLFEDRNLLEQIQGALTDVKTQLELTRQHDTQTTKSITEEVNATAEMVAATVESKVDDLHESLCKKAVLKVKTPSVWSNIRGWVESTLRPHHNA